MTPRFQELPHVYPFRFVERVVEKTGPASGRVRAAVTANGRRVDGDVLAPVTLAEMLAQAALLLQGGDPEIGRIGFLAGLSDFRVMRLPEPGDVLTIDVMLVAHFGTIVKLEGMIRDGLGRDVASGAVTVKQGNGGAA